GGVTNNGNGGAVSGTSGGTTGTESASGGGTATQSAAGTSGGSAGSSASAPGGGGSSAAAAGGGGSAAGAAGGPSTGTNCPDYNPQQGVFCDHFLVGGTTVLSGPLAVYGQQGLKAGQAWLSYFNSEVAPREHLRQVKLIWYDDNLDPNKTLQYV